MQYYLAKIKLILRGVYNTQQKYPRRDILSVSLFAGTFVRGSKRPLKSVLCAEVIVKNILRWHSE